MEANEALDLVAIGAFGAEAVMLAPHHVAHLLEEFFRVAFGWRWLYNGIHGFGF